MDGQKQTIKEKQTLKEKLLAIWNNSFFSLVPVRYALLAFALNLLVESMNRQSFIEAVVFMGTRPHLFMLCGLIIMATLSIGLFFKQRIFVTSFVGILWVGFSIANFIILRVRKAPLTAPDLMDIKEGIMVLPKYFNVIQMILLALLILGLIAGIVIFAIRSPRVKAKIKYTQVIAFVASSWLLVLVINFIGSATGLLGKNLGNLKEAYINNGFAYCFSRSIFGLGVEKPEDYDEKIIDVVDDLIPVESEGEEPTAMEPTSGVNPSHTEPSHTEPVTETQMAEGPIDTETQPDDTDGTVYPNIIFMQLESLFDPTLVKGLNFSEDPLPTLHALYENYASGYLNVPSYGGGTANTEFEVITGMNLDDFGLGEYPYKTVLKDRVCESVCYYLKDCGYRTAALHDNEGDFYGRNEVFPMLGFDTFTSIEYIEDYEINDTGWAKDECLIGEITQMLESSEEPNFIYAISVEGHGEYPKNIEEYDLPIMVTGDEDITGNPEGFIYYVNQIHDMDAVVAQLVDALEKIEEPTVLVLYGDHMPSFDLTTEDVTNGELYQTEYVIWDNIGLTKEIRTVEAHELSTLVLNRCGIEGGVIHKMHDRYLKDTEYPQDVYLDALHVLEYDILYGDVEAYEGELPWGITDMKMGYRPIVITDATNEYTHVSVKGEHFTRWSRVYINGEEQDTIFYSPNELLVKDRQLKPRDEIVVWQYSSSGSSLSHCESYAVESLEKMHENGGE